jgi:hypothetical protein
MPTGQRDRLSAASAGEVPRGQEPGQFLLGPIFCTSSFVCEAQRYSRAIVAVGGMVVVELPEKSCGLNGSMQHLLGVYWPEFQSPKFF